MIVQTGIHVSKNGKPEQCSPPPAVSDTWLSHPEWETKGSVVRLETHWSPLLQDGLMGCMQPLADRWHGVVIVMVGRRRVVVVVVDRLVGVIVLLLPEEIGVEVSVEVKMISFHFMSNVQAYRALHHRHIGTV